MTPRGLVGLALFATLAAMADDTVDDTRGLERSAIFARFDHHVHDSAMRESGMSCVGCHRIGTGQPGTGDAVANDFLVPPEASCHQCHAPGTGGLGDGAGMKRAPHLCQTCHEGGQKPDDHLVGWIDLHGEYAHEDAASCKACHTRASCTDCHDRRQTADPRVHDRTWLTVHGLAARADPTGCDSCHVQSECTSCHESDKGWGRSP